MRPFYMVSGLLLAAACGGSSEQGAVRGERERDSVIGQSQLRGAGGVQGALDASDSAAARNARLDSIAADQ
jgi:hypothetical protein